MYSIANTESPERNREAKPIKRKRAPGSKHEPKVLFNGPQAMSASENRRTLPWRGLRYHSGLSEKAKDFPACEFVSLTCDQSKLDLSLPEHP